jgi:hypothetical protein
MDFLIGFLFAGPLLLVLWAAAARGAQALWQLGR